MKRYRCDECEYECKLETSDTAPQPDTCVQLGHNVEWVRMIVIKRPYQQESELVRLKE
jgi:hypothetical protein